MTTDELTELVAERVAEVVALARRKAYRCGWWSGIASVAGGVLLDRLLFR